MKRIAKLSVGACALLAVAACDSGTVIKADSSTPTAQSGEATLATVRENMEAPADTRGPSIDPAAANIDPFSGIYSTEQREAFEANYEDMAGADDAVTASLEETNEFLSNEASTVDTSGYRNGLECAARFDLASKKGAIPAHEAQARAKEVLMTTSVSYEGFVRPDASEDQREPLVEEYRGQTYRNYMLVRDEMKSDKEADALLAEAEACYAALGLEPVQPEQVEDTAADAEG
tara:strand:+ start:33950 stop:34648 length:699 start_codon:yes stop_codon:yes gene_type:complete